MTWLIINQFLSLFRLSSQPKLFFNVANPAKLIRTNSTTGVKTITSIPEILEKCSSILGRSAWYTPTAWMASGHLMTIYCTIATFTESVHYSRQQITVPDGGTLSLDFSPPLTAEDPIDSRPILMVLHGLTGGSHESYVINVVNKATGKKEEGGLGWRGCVVNFRGCAGTKLSSNQLYNGGYTDDLRCALSYISSVAPKTPLYGVGFSLGANVLAKYLGQEGSSTPLKAGIVLGCPWDFMEGHVYLSSSWLRLIYSRAMAKNLRVMIARHKEELKGDKRVDWEALEGNPYQTLYEFDSIATAPLGGFCSAEAYYRDASSARYAENIAVPTLSLSSFDDPIVAIQTVPTDLTAKNPWIVFVETIHGGHLGWFEGFWKPKRWIGKPVVEFFREVEKADEEGGRLHPELGEEDEEGMRRVKGSQTVGFKVVEGGDELVEGNEAEGQGLIKGL